ncbi:amino acid adenylation domain-containing protein [Nocardia sp. NPDC050710]|uniref:amino acid adenylation domain-containing protein n=1 Tax=Nocardia sp. NPDC050710 TaxID=3157220 RepID=UPI0033F8CED7
MSNDILERRRQLMQQRLRESNLSASTPVQAARRSGEPAALSSAQRRLWFVQTLDPADTTLNICVAYRLDGVLDADQLRSACATVLARHETLRSTYHVGADGEPYQLAHDNAELVWQQHDLTDLPAESRARRLEVLARREFARPFDLGVDLPLRITLVRNSADEHVLILVIHHIAWDDESWAVFFGEVNAAYRGNAVLPPLRAQYVDVAVGADDSGEADLEFWRSALTPLPDRLELPGRGSSANPSAQADRCTRTLSAELMERAAAHGRSHSASPFMVLLAAFQTLIHRYTAATDFLVSVPVTNRGGHGAEALIGYFGNALLIRATPESSDSFAALLDSTRDACVGAFAHQGVGVDTVVREASPERVAGTDGMARLVQLSFSMRGDANGFDLPGIESSELPLGTAVAQEPLGLLVVSDGAGARIEATYLVDELDAPLVEQLLDQYLRLLDSALDEPDRPLRELDMLGATGRAGILAASHGVLVPESPTTVVELVQHRVRELPDHIAIASDELELSYAELNGRANRLAHWLIRHGIGAEDIVALRLATSMEFVVAALAVLKSGAAYLPIDPAYPPDRIEYLLSDAGPGLVLDPGALAVAEAEAALLPEVDPTDADRSAALLPGNTAYVIYTSGSTGRPKGVPVPHEAIAEHLTGFAAEWTITPQDRVLQSTSVSFDASLLDIFVTLVVGARVVIPKPNAYRDIPYVSELITRHQVTVLHMVPSMLATFLLLPEANDWRMLRHVPVGGEALPGEVADRFTAQFDATLRNHYGPTEAVVSSTHMPVEGPQGTGIVPIGVPNRNVYLYVLDHALQLVPTGVVGEIYLGGRQLARGYLGRPGLTAERFVADPFRPGERLYRTGDLVRRNMNGEIEFVGRADEQVKVRGFRIELGEVEAAITDHPSVAHSVVVVAEHASLGPILAAYLVPAPGVELDVQQVRAQLRTALPEHMVPVAFSVIDEVPLTAHGKLDRRALPEPIVSVADRYREPQSPTEIRLAALYARLFGADRVGADDSFFELGGHSLLAARLVTLIRAEFCIEIDVRAPFDTPTVAGLAAHLATRFRDESGVDLDAANSAPVADGAASRPDLTKSTRPERIPLSYTQRAFWFRRRVEGPREGENFRFALRFDGPLDTEILGAAVGDVVARHEALRTTFPEYDAVPYQRVSEPGPVDVPVTMLDSAVLDAALADEAAEVFDLAEGPLIRLRLFVIDSDSHVLSVVIHHIVTDRESCQIFVDDLTAAYRARAVGAVGGLPEPGIQFADFALWQREIFDHAPGGALGAYGRAQLDYWRDALAGLPDEVAIAHDRPRPAVLGRQGTSINRVIPVATWNALKGWAELAGATEFMLCQAASSVLLHVLGAGDDPALGTTVGNRIGAGTEDLIGVFADMAVLRTDLSGDPTVRLVLDRVRESALGAISHQDVPLECIIADLGSTRAHAAGPLFQVMMHFGQRLRPVDFTESGATTVTGYFPEHDIAYMDIHLDYTVEANGELTIRVVVNNDLYDPATGGVFADVLTRVMTAFAAEPDRPLSGLDVLPPEWDTGRTVVRRIVPAAPSSVESACGSPATATERRLAAILEDLLEITDVARDDNFFALGGDSIIAIQWATRAAEAELPLTPQQIFECATLAELAAAVDTAAAQSQAAAADQPVESHTYAPMSTSGLDADALGMLRQSWSAQT